MPLRSGVGLIFAQTIGLFKKNFLVYTRNRQAAITQTLAPVLMVILVSGINEAIKVDARRQDRFMDLWTPGPSIRRFGQA